MKSKYQIRRRRERMRIIRYIGWIVLFYALVALAQFLFGKQ